MKRTGCVLGVCGLLVIFLSSTWAQSPEHWDRYLDRYRGPYRGQVIDADTKAPLVGAVVVAMWTRDRVYPLHSVNERYAVRETVTDAGGRFVLDAKDVEDGAPRRVHHPEFLIFLPGYGAFPRYQRTPRGFIGGIFWDSGTTVELPRFETRQERIENLYDVIPHNFSEDPFKEIPKLTKAFNEERVALDLEPLSTIERRQ